MWPEKFLLHERPFYFTKIIVFEPNQTISGINISKKSHKYHVYNPVDVKYYIKVSICIDFIRAVHLDPTRASVFVSQARVLPG